MMTKKSKLGLGTWQFGDKNGFWPSFKTEDCKDIIRHAVKNGITTFDTAYSYENAENFLSSVLREKRVENPEIITKVMPTPSISKKISSSLKRLNPFIPCSVLLHWPTSDDYLLKLSLDALEDLKNKGIIKSFGLSNFPLSLLDKISSDYEISAIQRPISLIWSKELQETVQFSKDNNILLYGYSPLGMGVLSNNEIKDSRKGNLYVYDHKKELSSLLDIVNNLSMDKNTKPSAIALSWARHKGADCIFFGATKKSYIEQNLISVDLSEDEILALDEVSIGLSEKSNCDNMFNHRW